MPSARLLKTWAVLLEDINNWTGKVHLPWAKTHYMRFGSSDSIASAIL